MKKIVCLVLALVLALGLSVSAFADEVASGAVNVNVTAAVDATHKYSVTATWDTFEYTHANGGTWNPGTHKYDDKTDGTWNNDTVTVTVTNDSDMPITYSATFSDTSDDGIAIDTSNLPNEVQLDAVAENAASGNSGQFTLTASGTPTAEEGAASTGTLTVTFEAA